MKWKMLFTVCALLVYQCTFAIEIESEDEMSNVSRPGLLPEWGTSTDADVVEPSDGQKQDGWVADQRPPAGWENWYKTKVYEQIRWLDQAGLNTRIRLTDGGSWSSNAVRTASICVPTDADNLGWWVIAGEGGEIETSYNGTFWTPRTADDSFTGTFWGSGSIPGADPIAVLVGSSGEIQISNTLGTWHHHNSDNSYSDDFRDVSWFDPGGADILIAVGDSGEIQTSPDGETWTHQNSADSFAADFLSVIGGEDGAGNPRAVAVGDGGEIQYSSDGVTWVAATAAGGYSSDFYGVYYGILGDWRIGDPNSVTYGFVAGGGAKGIQYSYNGEDWYQATAPEGMQPNEAILGVAWGLQGWVAVTNNAGVISSRDGINWERNSMKGDDGHLSLVFVTNNGGYSAGGEYLMGGAFNGDGCIMTTLNIGGFPL